MTYRGVVAGPLEEGEPVWTFSLSDGPVMISRAVVESLRGWRYVAENIAKMGTITRAEFHDAVVEALLAREVPDLTTMPVEEQGAPGASFLATGEVRTTSDTGGQKGVKPEAFDLIPWEAMDEVARVYNAGAQKYAAHNWRNGYEWSKSFAAACRHLFAFWRGEDRDPELGTLHLANAVFHLLGLITFSLDRERYGRFDNRYRGDNDEQ